MSARPSHTRKQQIGELSAKAKALELKIEIRTEEVKPGQRPGPVPVAKPVEEPTPPSEYLRDKARETPPAEPEKIVDTIEAGLEPVSTGASLFGKRKPKPKKAPKKSKRGKKAAK